MEAPDDFVLPDKYADIPLEALNASCRKRAAMHLNLEGILNEDLQMVTNFLGLAEMIGFSYLEIRNFERHESPTEHLLADWTTRPELSPTVGSFWRFLVDLQRFDVLTDIWTYIKRDCDRYIAIKSRFPKKQQPVQDTTISQSTELSDHDTDEGLMMTVDDVIFGTQTKFDAFVCYNPEGNDLEFVREMIEILENQNGLKLFVPWRDDLPGASHNTVCAKLIEHRCKRMIIVLSPRYLKSSACDFQTKFAHGLSPGSKQKKLIPVIIEDCKVPEILHHVSCCNYTKKELISWFWKRLVTSIKAPLDPSECRSSNSNHLNGISLDTSTEVSGWSRSNSVDSSSLSNSAASSSASPYTSSSSASGSTTSNSRTSADYLELQSPYPPYLELLSNSPPVQRKSNDYERLSQLRRDNNSNNNAAANHAKGKNHEYTEPIATATSNVRSQSSSLNKVQNSTPLKVSPASQRRPVPPIPKESKETSKDKNEIFC